MVQYQAHEELVKHARTANERERREAFDALMEQFQETAWRWAYNVLGDAQMAQDAAQEAFLTAYQKIDQLRDPAAFPAWLKRIVMTECSRLTRRKTPDLRRIEDIESAYGDDPAASAEAREERERLMRAVRALPERERAVTEMFYLDGYSLIEIARGLELPLTTVKKRLQYARERIRETMPTSSLYRADGMNDSERIAHMLWFYRRYQAYAAVA